MTAAQNRTRFSPRDKSRLNFSTNKLNPVTMDVFPTSGVINMSFAGKFFFLHVTYILIGL
jgi:hypothetical protein